MVPLKYLRNFWRAPEMSLFNYEINLQLKWSKNGILVPGTVTHQNPEFKITDTKLCVTLSTQDNVKLLKQLESGFKRTIN